MRAIFIESRTFSFRIQGLRVSPHSEEEAEAYRKGVSTPSAVSDKGYLPNLQLGLWVFPKRRHSLS
jgi:hypothetical protein